MRAPSDNIPSDTASEPARRGFFGRVAGLAAIGFAGLAATPLRAEAAQTADGLDWPGKLKGRHRQVVDATAPNEGLPLTYALTFLIPNAPGTAMAVVVVRHAAMPIALNSAMWEKYKIGAALKVIDPETGALAVKNPYLNTKSGVLVMDDMAVDRLLGKGVIIGACNMALHAFSAKLAGNAGVSADVAAKEWAANIVPGVTVIPSGTWGVNRAQEAGCTYCSGG